MLSLSRTTDSASPFSLLPDWKATRVEKPALTSSVPWFSAMVAHICHDSGSSRPFSFSRVLCFYCGGSIFSFLWLWNTYCQSLGYQFDQFSCLLEDLSLSITDSSLEGFTMLSNDSSRACYGPRHVEFANDRMAIETLLMTENLFRGLLYLLYGG